FAEARRDDWRWINHAGKSESDTVPRGTRRTAVDILLNRRQDVYRAEETMKKIATLFVILIGTALMVAAPHSARAQAAAPAYSIDAIRYATITNFPLSGLTPG